MISLFDIKDNIGDISGIKVREMEDLEKYIRDEGVDVAIITVPREVCQDVANKVIDAGVRGIWNFAPYDLKGPEGVVVENIRLNDSLLTLSYFMKEII